MLINSGLDQVRDIPLPHQMDRIVYNIDFAYQQALLEIRPNKCK